MKILLLYSEIGPYNIPVLETLTQSHGAEVHVVHWDRSKLTPFVPPQLEGVRYFRRSEYTSDGLCVLAEGLEPDLVYISGWMDEGYLRTARRMRRRGVPVVSGFDDQWSGTARQVFGRFAMKLYYRRMISHAWVAGPRQYEYAKRLGFRDSEIVFDLLSCNLELFARAAEARAKDVRDYPRSFLYVGRFAPEKGLDLLMDAYGDYRRAAGTPWELTCVGNGPLKSRLEAQAGVTIRDYAAQADVAALCVAAGVFVMPSHREPWGVTAHECSAAGLPLLLSTAVGAGTAFLIDGLNGLSFLTGSRSSLAEALDAFTRMSDATLREMGCNSGRLAARITPSMSAASFLSILSRGRPWRVQEERRAGRGRRPGLEETAGSPRR